MNSAVRVCMRQTLTGCNRCVNSQILQPPRTRNLLLPVRQYAQKTKDPKSVKDRRIRRLLIITGVGSITYLLVKNPTDSGGVRNAKVTLYRKMPLKAISRIWGKMTCWNLPLNLREPLLGLYVRMFGVNLTEAKDPDLKNYPNLNEFFRRELKPNARVVDPVAPITSPADGRVLHFGCVEEGVVEQVKGVNYAMKAFLGPVPGKHDDHHVKPLNCDLDYHERLGIKEGHDLYHCIIYLAPGDYHRFHSATDWTVHHRRHFPGELLSVNPGVARWVQGLFNLNERAVYTGTWQHGYFSYTAVGATNVGSIKIYFDEDLETNIGRSYPDSVYHDRYFDAETGEDIAIKKGDMLGEFNLGSTIVLLFEAPSNYAFTVQPGQKVKFGESLGYFMS